MTDRTNRLALAAAEALHALAEALTDWAEDGLPESAASDHQATSEERQREQEMEDAWQARDWETVRRLQDEAEQQEDAPVPDPLDENDHRDRIDSDGDRIIRHGHRHWHYSVIEYACGSSSTAPLAYFDGVSGPLTFAPDAAPDAPRADLTASAGERAPEDAEPLDELLCPECEHEIDSHPHDNTGGWCECGWYPSDIAGDLIDRAIKAEREARTDG